MRKGRLTNNEADDFNKKQPCPSQHPSRAECRQESHQYWGEQKKSYWIISTSAPSANFITDGPCTQKCHKWQFPRGMIVLNVELQDISREIVQNSRIRIGEIGMPKASSLIDITPTPLENSYDVELADGKIVGIDTIIRGCTLNFLNHPFNIDLMPVETGSFDVIIGMDWLRRCHAVIVCDEKLVRIPYGNETLIFCGDKSNNGKESRLTIISCSKAQEYMAKGYFSEVFPEDLPGLPLARPVEFQIDLILGAAPSFFERRNDCTVLKKELSEQTTRAFNKRLHEDLVPPHWEPRYIIDSRGIHVDLAKIESIKDWASPKTLTEIRQFLGLTGYYRRFIKGFLKIAKSMTKLTQKGIKFNWGEKEEIFFQLIKQKLCSAPILDLPERSKDFVVYCDASHKGLGVMLMQREKVIAYVWYILYHNTWSILGSG
ncbi:putative reverse transcriptase domain-containing protein [Tanacetum coccineum]